MTDKDRELGVRLTKGDLAEEFQRSLDEISDADPVLSGRDNSD